MNESQKDYLKGHMVQKVHIGADDGKDVVQSFQDIDHILESNKIMNAENSLSSKYVHRDTGMGVHLASIPEIIYHKWMKEFQAKHNRELPPSLSDPEWKMFLLAKATDPENRAVRVDGRTYRLGKQNG